MKFRFNQDRMGRLNSFGNVLPSIVKEFNLEESFLIERIKNEWSQIVGDMIATHSKPDRIFKKIMFVYVDHSVYSNELSIMQELIKEKINELFGFEIIKRIKVEVKSMAEIYRKKIYSKRKNVHTYRK